MTPDKKEAIIEAALMVAGEPLPISALQKLFSDEADKPSNSEMKAYLTSLATKYIGSGIELKEVASGFRLQARSEYTPWLSKLWEERPARYTRAFLETLAIIAYKQPVTRAEIEEIRGVTVSTNIMKSLQEREWVKVLGYKEVPGKPAIYGTTKNFLDDFNLKSLTELPTLAEFENFEKQDEKVQIQLALADSNVPNPTCSDVPEEDEIEIADDDLQRKTASG